MDDEEYYSKMRNYNLNRSPILSQKKSKYSKWKIEQGREDAEMLAEKNSDNKTSEQIENNSFENNDD